MDTATKTWFEDAAKITSRSLLKKLQQLQEILIGDKIAAKLLQYVNHQKKKKPKKIEENYIPPEKRQQIIDHLRLF